MDQLFDRLKRVILECVFLKILDQYCSRNFTKRVK